MYKVNIQDILIDSIFESVQRGNGTDIRGKHKAAVDKSIVQGFFPDAIPEKVRTRSTLSYKAMANIPLHMEMASFTP